MARLDRDMPDGGGDTAPYVPEDSAAKNAVENNPDTTPKEPAYSELTPAERQAMTQQEKLDAIKKEREDRSAASASARAESDPIYDFENRPPAPEPNDSYIFYYSWIGGRNSGQWKLYRAPKTDENMAKYGSRAVGGETQATNRNIVGANALISQPQPIWKDGYIVGYSVPKGGLKPGSKWNGKTVQSKTVNGDGSYTVTYSDGSTENFNSEGGSDSSGGYSATSSTSTSSTSTSGPTTNIDVMKSILRGMGFNSKIINSSSSFLDSLLKDGLDYDNAVEVFLNSQDYTLKNGSKIKSPFYEEYGYLNEGLVNPKTPGELYNAVEGYKGIVDKYGVSPKFLTPEALKGYVKNNITVADLDERANMARLKAINADNAQISAMIKLGFIASAADLTDFYMDPKIGKEQLELNRNTGAFTAEAIRRAQTGISFDKTSFERLSAGLTAKGLTESQISALAAQGFENIGGTLNPLTMYSQMYEKTGGTVASNKALQEGLQQELMGEQFLGTASEKRKKLTELAARSFEGRSAFYAGKTNVAGAI